MQAAFSAGAICSRATAADLITISKRRAGRPAFKGRMAPFPACPNKTAEKLLCSSHQAQCWQPNHAAVRAIRLGLVLAVSRYSFPEFHLPNKSRFAIAVFAVRFQLCFSFSSAGTFIIRSADAGLRDAIARQLTCRPVARVSDRRGRTAVGARQPHYREILRSASRSPGRERTNMSVIPIPKMFYRRCPRACHQRKRPSNREEQPGWIRPRHRPFFPI